MIPSLSENIPRTRKDEVRYHAEHVEPIKAWTQSGRTKKIVASEVIFDADSRSPLSAGTGFQAMLRAGGNRDRAARGIRDYVMEDPREATSRLRGDLFVMATPRRGRLSSRRMGRERGRKRG